MTIDVLHAAPVVLPVSGPPVHDGAVAVTGGRVAAVGPRAEVAAAYPDARVREWRGVLAPGLVNAHAHLEYTDFADLASSGLGFFDWIRTLTARRAEFTPLMWLESARRGVHAMLRTGTTCVADVVTHGPGLRAAGMAGMAGVSYLESVGVTADGWPAERDRLAAALSSPDEARALGVSPHAPYTLDVDVFRGLAALAREHAVRLHTHVAETREECEYVERGAGPFAGIGLGLELDGTGVGVSPVRYVDSLGALGPDVHVAHGVHAGPDDRAVLRERGTAVALCVRSNEVLGCGEPPVGAYLAEGSPLCVGTDSLASAPDLDLLAELAAVRRLARAQGADPPAERLFRLVTADGARALGLAGAGVIEAGARADLAVFDVPLDEDPYEAVVGHGAGRCAATVLAGRLVHR